MAKLDAKDRKSLPRGDFAVPSKAPGSGSYPIPDASHARNALARAAQHGSPAVQAAVKAKVKAKFPGIGQGGKGASSRPPERDTREQSRPFQDHGQARGGPPAPTARQTLARDPRPPRR